MRYDATSGRRGDWVDVNVTLMRKVFHGWLCLVASLHCFTIFSLTWHLGTGIMDTERSQGWAFVGLYFGLRRRLELVEPGFCRLHHYALLVVVHTRYSDLVEICRGHVMLAQSRFWMVLNAILSTKRRFSWSRVTNLYISINFRG